MPGAPGVPLRRRARPAIAPVYHVRIKSRDLRGEWDALTATIRPEMTACWDHLAMTPTLVLDNGRCHRLKGALRNVWQYKPTTGHNFRVWYHVDEHKRIVLVTEVHATHP